MCALMGDLCAFVMGSLCALGETWLLMGICLHWWGDSAVVGGFGCVALYVSLTTCIRQSCLLTCVCNLFFICLSHRIFVFLLFCRHIESEMRLYGVY